MIREKTIISNNLGLHARAAAKLVQTATQFRSKVTLTVGRMCADAKSILGVLTLAAGKDTHVCLETDGPDEREAADTILELIRNGFGEE